MMLNAYFKKILKTYTVIIDLLTGKSKSSLVNPISPSPPNIPSLIVRFQLCSSSQHASGYTPYNRGVQWRRGNTVASQSETPGSIPDPVSVFGCEGQRFTCCTLRLAKPTASGVKEIACLSVQ